MYKVLYLSPMIPSFNLERTSAFFKDVLNFEFVMNEETYVILYKDNLTIHLLPAGENIGQTEFYLEVDNVDRVWEFMKDKIEGMKVKPPFDREYGMREVHIAVPDTNTLLFIGQSIR